MRKEERERERERGSEEGREREGGEGEREREILHTTKHTSICTHTCTAHDLHMYTVVYVEIISVCHALPLSKLISNNNTPNPTLSSPLPLLLIF